MVGQAAKTAVVTKFGIGLKEGRPSLAITLLQRLYAALTVAFVSVSVFIVIAPSTSPGSIASRVCSSGRLYGDRRCLVTSLKLQHGSQRLWGLILFPVSGPM
jgi:hypothetical protein